MLNESPVLNEGKEAIPVVFPGDDVSACSESDSVLHVDDVEMLLARIEHLMRTQGKAELADLGVTRDQFHALLALCKGELTMGELSERLGVSCSTVTDLVDRMERAGLAERVRDEADRRVVRVRITRGGETVLSRVRERRRRYLGRVLASMTEEEQSMLRDLLARVHLLLSYQPEP